MVWKLLRRNISLWQITGYAVATFVGLSIVLVALQFYMDASSVLSSGGDGGMSLISNRNIVISKPVSLTATLTGESPSFSAEEIAEIAAQPWAGNVSPFQAADFSVRAGIELGDRALQTALFLESIPDSLIDIDRNTWSFDSSRPSIPIVISKDYLALYNFGFASSGRMPMISEGMLSSVPLQITIAGNGQSATLPARIVGYSSWLNTVAVPQAFMDWAHARFGSATVEAPSRLVITVTDTADPAIEKFFAERDYEQAGQGNDLGRATYFLRLLASVVGIVGLVIVALALGILVLSLFLLIQKNQRVIRGLLLIGYSPTEVARSYVVLVCVVNGVVLLMSAVALALVAPLWRTGLENIGLEGASMWLAWTLGIGLMGFITLINISIVYRLVRKVFMLN